MGLPTWWFFFMIGDKMLERTRWTYEQEQFLINNHNLSITDISVKLQRTYNSIRWKRQQLGLTNGYGSSLETIISNSEKEIS